MAVLSFQDFSLSIDKGPELVRSINLKIEAGEIHGLIGESGSGKSLSAMSIVRLLSPSIKITSGKIELNFNNESKEVSALSASEMREIRGDKVGIVFQDPMTSLNPSIRCGSQVSEVIREHKGMGKAESKKKVIELFHKVKLPDPEKIYRSYPHEISGGQRQRVMIAMSVACDPKLLIADEPTTALDVTVQKSIIDLIDELRKSEGLAVLFISHDLGLISEYADVISIMYKGEIVESGTKSEIIQGAKHPYTQGLLSCKPPMDRRLKRLPTLEDSMEGKVKIEIEEMIEPADPTILLQVKDLNVFYTLKRNVLGNVSSEMHALKNVSFSLYKKESLALVGESGSGKSTLGRSILHLLETRSGNIIYDGKAIRELSTNEFRELRKRMQFIFQDPFSSLNPKKLIGDVILEPLHYYKIGRDKEARKKRVYELLEKVGLSASDYHKYPHQFSGGQRQRIVIARALTVEPEFIICDEAVSALDVSVQAKILNLLKDLQEEFSLTYLFITHDMSVVRFFCERLLVLKDGEVIESGNTEEVFKNPKNAFTKELIQASF